MSKANDRGRIVLGALIDISKLDDAREMKRIALEALAAIGVIRLVDATGAEVKEEEKVQ